MTNKENNMETYFNSFSSAVAAARAYAESKGFFISQNDWFTSINCGPKKPGVGVTNRYVLDTYGMKVSGKRITNYEDSFVENVQVIETKKTLAIQVYGMEGGRYELNCYLN